jgi:hypothetical protein
MATNKCAVAGGVALVGVVAIATAAAYCRGDFAEAVAAGDFQRAERRAGLLAINDVVPVNWAACGFLIVILGLGLVSLAPE